MPRGVFVRTGKQRRALEMNFRGVLERGLSVKRKIAVAVGNCNKAPVTLPKLKFMEPPG
jgi:hypothetical protein